MEIDSRGAIRGARTASGELVKLDRVAGKTGGTMQRLSGWLKGLVAVEALRRLAMYTGRIAEIGSTAEETGSKFATVFGGAAQGLDDRLAKLANRAGMTQTEIRGLAATAGAVGQGMGMAQDASAGYAADLLELAADVASFSNVQGGATRVMEAFIAATTGEREQLKALGIVISEEDVKQRQATRSAKGHADAMTQQGKATATLELITERAGKAVGDLARTEDSAANTKRRLSAEIREQEERFARLNMVAVQYVQGVVADLIRKNGEAGTSFAEKLAKGVLYAVGTFVEIVKGGGRVVSALANLGRTAGTLASEDGGLGVFSQGLDAVLDDLDRFARGVMYTERLTAKVGRTMLKVKGLFGADVSQEIKDLDDIIADVTERIADLDKLGEIRNADGVFGGAFADALAEFEAFAEGLDNLPPLADSLDDLVDGLAGAIGDASDRAQQARDDAAKEAEQARRRRLDQEMADRDLRIQAMAEGLDRELAEIALAFDERREAYRRGYGVLTAEEDRLFAQAQARREVQARAAAFSAAGSAEGRGALQTDGREDGFNAERERSRELREEIVGDLRDVKSVAIDVGQTTAGTLAGIAENYGDSVGSTLDALSGLFAQAGQEGGKFFEVSKALAVASALVNTYVAASRAYAEGGPIVGPILAAGMIAQGLALVAQIRAQKPGGSSGGGSSAGQSTSNAASRGPSSLAAGLAFGANGTSAPAPNVTVGGPTVNVAPAPPPDVYLDGVRVNRQLDESRRAQRRRRGTGGGL